MAEWTNVVYMNNDLLNKQKGPTDTTVTWMNLKNIMLSEASQTEDILFSHL